MYFVLFYPVTVGGETATVFSSAESCFSDHLPEYFPKLAKRNTSKRILCFTQRVLLTVVHDMNYYIELTKENPKSLHLKTTCWKTNVLPWMKSHSVELQKQTSVFRKKWDDAAVLASRRLLLSWRKITVLPFQVWLSSPRRAQACSSTESETRLKVSLRPKL